MAEWSHFKRVNMCRGAFTKARIKTLKIHINMFMFIIVIDKMPTARITNAKKMENL